MKKLLNYIGLFLLLISTGCSNKGNNENVYSEWSFQCRQTGEYIYEDNGSIKFGKEPANDSYLWIAESTETESVKFKNKKTGNYLQLDADGNVVSKDTENANENNLTWSYKGFGIRQMKNCGWFTISNLSGGEDKFLTQTPDGLRLESLDRNADFNSHWTVVREKGSLLPYTLSPDSVVEASFLGLRTSKAISPTEILSNYHGDGGHWKLKEDISAFPQFTADNNTMVVALYNMALEEMQMNLRSDSTFSTGALWPDTWTRDVVYSMYFSFSWIHQDISKKTLRKQTLDNPKEALQDTGTGGSWPISTDRVVWALAAWEYYLSTGDKEWLAEVYDGLSYTATKDIHVAFDKNIGLFRGETCSMDWRTHTYPNWFSNENIGESFSSGTNALHMFMYEILMKSGKMLGKSDEEINVWEKYYTSVKNGLNKYFWDKERSLYTAYLYPEYLNYRSTQRVDVMGNGLCALLGATSPEQTVNVVENFPLYPYGAAVLYPTIPDDFAYHNKSVWAVWQTPYMYAAKRVGNMTAASHIMKSQIRQGAMFLTHKENMTHDTGYDRNTALNSDRQLWSVASYVSIVYRMLFGMEMTETGLKFNPIVPSDMINGALHLKNFKYRDAVLDITVNGLGNKVKSLKVNGKVQTLPFELPAASKGKFDIEIEMEADPNISTKINMVEAGPRKCWSPIEPVLKEENSKLSWVQNEGLKSFVYDANINETATSPYDLNNKPNGFYSVYTVDQKGFESDLSNPFIHSTSINIYEVEDAKYKGTVKNSAKGFSGKGYIEDMANNSANVELTIDIKEAGNYGVALIGSNGRGPHDVYCYIRSVFVDDVDTGTFILESSGDWNTWTTSNYLILKNIPAGTHIIKLRLNPENKGFDSNMSHGKKDQNDAFLDYLKVVKL
ncbi:carbohydrate-binding protein [Dysgonomonas sp. ZJ279]|uniref:carbohydrate-binding protein n=1 Tax=Dysgonomonas sp. ZJ279 TaxID=2709796 RepID=UPI0021082808|nr:carbohydrate-binding protein [Dysgonomonas sp. ZJ279]